MHPYWEASCSSVNQKIFLNGRGLQIFQNCRNYLWILSAGKKTKLLPLWVLANFKLRPTKFRCQGAWPRFLYICSMRLEFPYLVHNSLPPVRILGQLIPSHILTIHIPVPLKSKKVTANNWCVRKQIEASFTPCFRSASLNKLSTAV